MLCQPRKVGWEQVGWEWLGGRAQEGGDICILMADSQLVQQKPIQHC